MQNKCTLNILKLPPKLWKKSNCVYIAYIFKDSNIIQSKGESLYSVENIPLPQHLRHPHLQQVFLGKDKERFQSGRTLALHLHIQFHQYHNENRQ